MATTGDARANKRKFGSGKGSPYAATTRRGPPGIFVTCESGREKKCQREALEVMHHYYYLSREQAQDDKNDATIKQKDEDKLDDHNSDINTADDDNATKSNNEEQKQDQEEKQLTLEEELSLLRKGVMAEEVLTYERNPKRQKGGGNNKNKLSSMKSPFSAYESGVRGMICILCNLPGCEVIPYHDIVAKIHAARKEKAENEASSANDDAAEAGEKVECENKEIVNDEDNKMDNKKKHSSAEKTLWDPVDTVRRIMEGVAEESNPTNASKALSSPPSSRFISRMLPMQATVSGSMRAFDYDVRLFLSVHITLLTHLLHNELSPCIVLFIC